jgi:hypothetical protein
VKPFFLSVSALIVTSPVFRWKMCIQNVILGLLYIWANVQILYHEVWMFRCLIILWLVCRIVVLSQNGVHRFCLSYREFFAFFVNVKWVASELRFCIMKFEYYVVRWGSNVIFYCC